MKMSLSAKAPTGLLIFTTQRRELDQMATQLLLTPQPELRMPRPSQGAVMFERIYLKRNRNEDNSQVFNPNAPFPNPDALVLKIERTVDSCRFVEHLNVTDAFFAGVLQRALREGYYSQDEVTESMAKLRALIDRRCRALHVGRQNFG